MLRDKIKVAVGLEFLSAFSAIPRREQAKVLDFVNKFRRDPTQSGINYEKIQSARDPKVRSVRIDLEYRGIVIKPDKGDVYVLVWVDHHDRAYAWARNRIFEVNPTTGGLQIIDTSHSQETDTETSAARLPSRGATSGTADSSPSEISGTSPSSLDPSQPSAPSHAQPSDHDLPGLFDKFSDIDLLRFGVPQLQLELIRQIKSEAQLDRLQGQIPEEAYEALYLLAAGTSLEEVAAELDRPEKAPQIDTTDFAAALEQPDSRRRFYVVDDDLELAAILQAPLEHWRVFLHPSQRKLIERDWSGPVRVLGGAGTGKTVAAMHRACWLAEQRLTRTNDRILFTTYTRNLADDVAENLSKICSDAALKRIEVINLDRWVANFLRRKGYEYKIDFGKATDELWKQALQVKPDELSLDDAFYRDEWERVVQPLEVATLDEYVRAPRLGRGVQLNRKERKVIWPVFEEYRLLLDKRRLREPVDAFRDARVLLEQQGDPLPYSAIIVDEGQDFGPQAYRLMRQMVASQANDLFIVGDAHQRIYRHTVTLSKCGVNVRGRSKKLRLNYRTTEETRRFAVGLLEGLRVDDLDDGIDTQQGYKSLTHGDVPQVRSFASFREEVAGLVEHLQALVREGVPLANICLVARTDELVGQYQSHLEQQGLVVHRISRTTADDRSIAGVRMATMHRVKGLEFDHVIIAGAHKGVVPLNERIGPVDQQIAVETDARERALVYVAATRARIGLLLTCVKTPSHFIPKTS